MVRMSAEERRESVIRAASTEFARTGYHGTSTETIARRVGVSQPYLFRLFPSKRAIFLAAAERCLEDTARMFRQAAEGLHGEEAHLAMAAAYLRAIADDPDRLLMQMQVYATVAALDAAGDRDFGDTLRQGWIKVWETASEAVGSDQNEATTFMAYGMLINTLVSLGFPPDHAIWSTVWDESRPVPPGAPAGESPQEQRLPR
jgi:AcrR family transcriptional regulator